MESTLVDKKTINNYIVSMRNVVKRSMVHTINKMARQSKHLRARKGTEEQKEKNVKKAERFVQEIMVIKELDKDEVSRFGLTTTQDLTDLQGNMEAPLKIRALARLCMNKFVATEIKEFKKKYPISEGKVLKILSWKKSKLKNLKPSVQKDLSKTETVIKEIKNRTTGKSNSVCDSGNESEESVNFNRSESESGEESVQTEEEVGSASEEEEDVDTFSRFKSDEEIIDGSIVNKVEDGTRNIKLDDNTRKVNIVSKKKDESSKKRTSSLKEDNIVSKNLETCTAIKQEDDMENSADMDLDEDGVDNFADMDSEEDDVENSADMDSDEDDVVNSTDMDLDDESMQLKSKVKMNKKIEAVKAVDPFFITKENKEYVTSQVPMTSSVHEKYHSKFNQSEGVRKFGSNFEDKNTGGFQTFTKYRSERLGSMYDKHSPMVDEKHRQKYGFSAKADGVGDWFKNRRERRLHLQKNIGKPKESKKLPRFNSNKVEKMYNNRDTEHVVHSKPNVEKLHPSWEAKKKLTSIVEFQGKKISFDD